MNNTWHFWITHNTFYHGVDRWMGGGGNEMPGSESDHVKGDGSTDIGNASSLWTVSYNRYIQGGKTALVGGGGGAAIGHGTFHHNWFYDCDERHPRVRNGWVHVFNNLYDFVGGDPDSSDQEYGYGYGIGAGHRANIVSEGNTFIRTFRPYVISVEWSCHAAGPNSDGNSNTLSNDAPGIIITSLARNAAALAGRALVPDSLDSWSKGGAFTTQSPPFNFALDNPPQWYFEEELTLPNGPAFTNDRRNNGNMITYEFVPFNLATGWQTDGQTGTALGGPNGSFAARPAINNTLSSIGVQSAEAGASRVRQLAGVMPDPGRR
jgi:pectate lyase